MDFVDESWLTLEEQGKGQGCQTLKSSGKAKILRSQKYTQKSWRLNTNAYLSLVAQYTTFQKSNTARFSSIAGIDVFLQLSTT